MAVQIPMNAEAKRGVSENVFCPTSDVIDPLLFNAYTKLSRQNVVICLNKAIFR